MTYVGCAEDDKYDQVLDSVMVGPVPQGLNKFVFQADAPDPAKIPEGSILGVTVVMLTCSYKEAEFIRVGYYVNNEYAGEQPQPLPQNQQIQQHGTGAMGLAAAAAGAGAVASAGAANADAGMGEEEEDDDDEEMDMEDNSKENDAAMYVLQRAVLMANLDKVTRTILSDKPRVTRFAIDW